MPKSDKELYGLRYSQFVPCLVKAIQEQQSLIEQQQQKINELNEIVSSTLKRLEALEKIVSGNK